MKKTVRFLAFIIAASVSAGILCTDGFAAEILFDDVSSDAYYYDAVCWAADKGITCGTTETTFSPAQSVTRAQLVTFLYRASGEPSTEDLENSFSDVDEKEDYAYYDAILWASSQGITVGKNSEKTFCPYDAVSRAEVVTMLYRYYGSPSVEGVENYFSDIEDDDTLYYYNAMLWAYEKEIVNGISTLEIVFGAESTCTRGEFVTLLYRAENAG